MKRVIYHPEARRELDDAVMYYEAQQRGVGERLLTQVIISKHKSGSRVKLEFVSSMGPA